MYPFFKKWVVVVERITAQRSARRQDYGHFFKLRDQTGQHRNQIPPGMDMDNQGFFGLVNRFKKMFQQGRRKMRVVFGDPLKKIHRHVFHQNQLSGRKSKFLFSVGQRGKNFCLYAVFPQFFAQFRNRHGWPAINNSRFVGSTDLDNFQPANFKIRMA